MKHDKNNILLAAGLLFIFGGILLLVHLTSDIFLGMYILRFLLFSVSGGIALYLALTGTKPAFFIFTGLFLSSCSLLFLITDARLLPYSLHEIWPLLVVLSGLFLFPAGYVRFRKLQAAYLVPGLTLTGLGFVFLCFSLDIIKISFADFARTWWPIIFIIFGLALVILFFYMQKQKQPVFCEDSEDDDEEDLQ
ncbi:hypothetical protein H0R92_02180 [Treponema sp. OMZ 840]|uniref:LiaI-LiaF-like domain-containing protein n=1 Tax=Treponema sp. OMZ 840 TaxID=244313 RepID=UPI003D8A6FEC